MASKIGVLGLAAGLLLAAPGIAGAHGHHSEGRNVRQEAHRHQARHVQRHHVRQHRRHRGVRQHRHVLSHGRRGEREVTHGSYWCSQCRSSFREQARFFRHLQHDHRLHRGRLWQRLVRTGWGWAFYW